MVHHWHIGKEGGRLKGLVETPRYRGLGRTTLGMGRLDWANHHDRRWWWW